MVYFPHVKPYTQTPAEGESSNPATGRDRGTAAYFHGRNDIISSFEIVLSDTITLNAGTTFLIQGAPGAGKTALLDVLSHQSKPKGWTVADIAIQDLYNPASMAQSLGKSYSIDKKYACQVGVQFLKGGVVGNIAGHASSRDILKHLAPETGLILVLDEAQYLSNLDDTPTEKHLARDTLDKIHNGGLDKPIMLLAAGLGTTESAFNSLGISRFAGESLINLGRLDKESEREVIRDWIVKEGGAKGNLDPWIDAIVKETHGWPQHIISYVKPAVRYLKSNNRQMTDEGLRIVLEKGNESRINYYETRAKEFSLKQRQVIASFIPDLQQSGYLEKEDIMDVLTSKYGEEKSKKFFEDVLHSGIISQKSGGVYGVPIPSMQTWLIEEYGREQIEMLKVEDELSKVRRESPNQEKDSSKWSRER